MADYPPPHGMPIASWNSPSRWTSRPRWPRRWPRWHLDLLVGRDLDQAKVDRAFGSRILTARSLS